MQAGRQQFTWEEGGIESTAKCRVQTGQLFLNEQKAIVVPQLSCAFPSFFLAATHRADVVLLDINGGRTEAIGVVAALNDECSAVATGERGDLLGLAVNQGSFPVLESSVGLGATLRMDICHEARRNLVYQILGIMALTAFLSGAMASEVKAIKTRWVDFAEASFEFVVFKGWIAGKFSKKTIASALGITAAEVSRFVQVFAKKTVEETNQAEIAVHEQEASATAGFWQRNRIILSCGDVQVEVNDIPFQLPTMNKMKLEFTCDPYEGFDAFGFSVSYDEGISTQGGAQV